MLLTKKQMKTKQQTKQTKQTNKKKTTEISLGLCLPSWIKLKLWDEFQPC